MRYLFLVRSPSTIPNQPKPYNILTSTKHIHTPDQSLNRKFFSRTFFYINIYLHFTFIQVAIMKYCTQLVTSAWDWCEYCLYNECLVLMFLMLFVSVVVATGSTATACVAVFRECHDGRITLLPSSLVWICIFSESLDGMWIATVHMSAPIACHQLLSSTRFAEPLAAAAFAVVVRALLLSPQLITRKCWRPFIIVSSEHAISVALLPCLFLKQYLFSIAVFTSFSQLIAEHTWCRRLVCRISAFQIYSIQMSV